MEPNNFYDYDAKNSSSQRPQHTQFLDLTNGEGGENRSISFHNDDGYAASNNLGNRRSIAAAMSSTMRASNGLAPAGSSDTMTELGSTKLDPNTPGRLVETGQEHTGRWTTEEHDAFLIGIEMYGKEWKKVAAKVKTRTVVQTRTHAQKYFQKLKKENEGQKFKKENEGQKFKKEDEGQDDMASEARRAGSAVKKKTRMTPVTTNKIERTTSVNTAAHLISTLSGQHSLPPLTSSRPLEASPIPPGGHVSSEPRHYSMQGASRKNVTIGNNNFLDGRSSTIGTSAFPSMKIVAPEHDSAMKRGKFPEPSPAACGKRKLAEIAAARLLAGVASSTPAQTQNSMGQPDGTATPPPESERTITTPSRDTFEASKNLKVMGIDSRMNVTEGSDSLSAVFPKKTIGMSLQIVNPESLGLSHQGIMGRKADGLKSPVTPWEGQLQALVSEEKMKVPPKDSTIGGLPTVPKMEERSLNASSSIHPICCSGSAYGRSLLHKAVCDMDIAVVQSQLSSQPDYFDRRDGKGYCPIHSACALCLKNPNNSFRTSEIVRLLIAAGADASIRDPEGNTPLHWAARAGDRATAQLLLVKNSPKDAKNERGETPLHWAMRAGRVGIPVVSILIENGARPSVWNVQFKRPIDVAADGFFDEPDPVMEIRALDEKKKKLKKEQRQKLREAAKERKEARANLFDCSAQSRTLVLYHPECSEHIPKSERDWERPDRISSIMERIRHTYAVSDTPSIYPREIQISQEFERAKLDLLSRVHSTEYLNFVNELSKDLERQHKEQNANNGKNKDDSGAPPVVPFTPMVQRSLTKVQESSVKISEDSDTSFSAGSLRAARRAAGAVQHAVDCVLVGRHRNAFCIVRPPGHHAGINGLLDGGESCGFCIFNSVAAGAMHAISDERLMCERCAIVDLDAHHGNGTEEIVRKCHDPGKLFFFSIHLYDNDSKGKRETKSNQYKFYPGTGDEDDLPLNIINVPIIPLWKEVNPVPVVGTHNTRHRTRIRASQSDDGSSSETGTPRVSDAEVESRLNRASSPTSGSSSSGGGRQAYRKAIQNRLLPALRAFNPDLILISAGFDACKGDVGNAKHEDASKQKMGIDLEPQDYAWTTSKILEIADICCQGRVVSVLEGGYGRSRIPGPGEDANFQPLDKSVFSECAIRHAHAMIDPYNVEERFGSSRKNSL
eukprot:jgi/Psemu1/263567/estExt_Genewise1Plus.C_10800004